MKFDTDPAKLFSAKKVNSTPIRTLTAAQMKSGKSGLPKAAQNWAEKSGFTGAAGQHCLVSDGKGDVHMVLYGLGAASEMEKTFSHGKLARILPPGTYHLHGKTSDPVLADMAWALGGYSFERYKKKAGRKPAKLVAQSGRDGRRLAEAVFITRDLINTPANDMGPNALEAAIKALAIRHKAKLTVTKGDQLLKKNFPMVHAVGRASADAPRVLDLVWGNAKHPKVTLVGKGVTFDTGGLNIKPGNSMGLMKKDMGGAANVLGLAHLIMDAKLPVRLRVIIGAVENSISSNAFRPGDVLNSRKGISVEIGNTDAEGRLVLGDCLALGDEDKPEIMIDMATLTGAARVALGPDLPPFYCDDEKFASDLSKTANKQHDPLWRMPLWQPYNAMMSSKIADVNHINTSGAGFAGSITAALFLQRFVENTKTWAHFDIYAWMPAEKPWAPVGGEAQGIRALFALFQQRFG